jgi:hypothetical protein
VAKTVAPVPNTRVQRTRSSASPPHSPQTRSPLGASARVIGRGLVAFLVTGGLAVIPGCRTSSTNLPFNAVLDANYTDVYSMEIPSKQLPKSELLMSEVERRCALVARAAGFRFFEVFTVSTLGPGDVVSISGDPGVPAPPVEPYVIIKLRILRKPVIGQSIDVREVLRRPVNNPGA